MSIRMTILICWVALGLSACGADGDGEPASRATQPPAASEKTTAPPGFLAYEYKPVDPKTCDNKVSLGDEGRLTIEAPETVGTTIFSPGCVTDTGVDQVEITLDNTSTNLHNIIVEGNDHELVVGAGEKGTATFELAPDEVEIGFQCTIHDRMYGAFFR